MKEHPMLFNDAMVRAILAGEKTQTRRLAKRLQCLCSHPITEHVEHQGFTKLGACGKFMLNTGIGKDATPCPYGQPGDRLWVRETFAVYGDEKIAAIHYRADRPHDVGRKGMGYKPSIHMPRWASRILLEITAVRVERLQDISQADAQAEGITDGGCLSCGNSSYPTPCFCDNPQPDYRDAFCHLWGQINGPASWHTNPWLWVVEFRRVQP